LHACPGRPRDRSKVLLSVEKQNCPAAHLFLVQGGCDGASERAIEITRTRHSPSV